MPRNSAGVYSLPESPFVANTPISSSATNSNNSDLASAMTDSLSRDGQGGMNAQLHLALSGFNYSSDPDTGMSRSAANTQVVTCGGEDWTFTATDLTAPDGSSLAPLIGEIRMWALSTAPSGWLLMQGQACTTSYPLWRAALIADGNPYGTSGGDPLFPDLRCTVPAGKDTSRGLLTGATVLGALLGAQMVTLGTTNLPPYTPSGPVSAPTITINGQNAGTLTFGGAPQTLAPPPGVGGVTVVPLTATASAPNFTGNAQGGASTPFSVVQPTIVINFIGRAA